MRLAEAHDRIYVYEFQHLERMLEHWGKECVKQNDTGTGFCSTSIIYRMITEGIGAGHATTTHPTSITMSADDTLINTIVMRLPESLMISVILHYTRPDARTPWNHLGISRSSFYRRLNRARSSMVESVRNYQLIKNI